MPQVPIQQGPRAQEAALSTPTQRVYDVTGGMGKIGEALTGAFNIADKIVQRDAEDEARKVELQLRTDWQAQRRALREQYKADQADMYEAKATEWWKQAPSVYGANVSERAKRIVNKSLGDHALAANADTLGYVEGEKRKSREINFGALQDQIIRDAEAMVTPTNATAMADMVNARLRENAIRYATSEGFNSTVAENLIARDVGRYHAAVATSLANKPGGADAAQAYLTKFGEAIPLATRSKLEEAVKAEGDNQFALQFALQQASKPLTEQIKAASEIADPARREKAIQQVKLTYAMVKEQQAEVEKRASDQAWQLFAQGKPIPETLLREMDGRERASLAEQQRIRAERLAGGQRAVKTDPKALAAVYDMMRDDPEKFKNLRMTALVERIAPSDMEQIARIQRDMSKPDAERDAVTTAQLVGAYTRGMNDDRKSAFEKAFYDRVLAFKDSNSGRPPNDKEKRAIVDDLMLTRDNGWLDFGKKFKFEMTPEEAAKARFTGQAAPAAPASAPRQPAKVGTIYNISGSDRKLIEQALRAEGRSVTEDAIQERYRLVKGSK